MSIIRGLEDALEHGKKELARRSDALRIKEEMLQASWEANRRLSEVHLVQAEFRRQTDPHKHRAVVSETQTTFRIFWITV
jgi:hypothetical protein